MNIEFYLIYISIILLIGTMCSTLAYKLNTSNVFFLLLAGMIFGSFNLIEFPQIALITISMIALILVVFDSTNKFSFKEFLKESVPAIKLSLVFFAINIIVIGWVTSYFFGISAMLSVLLASIVYGIDPMIAMSTLRGKNEITSILKIESIINTPLTLIVPFTLLPLISQNVMSFGTMSSQIVPFLQQIIMGIGIGVIMGFFVVMIMKHNYMGDLSHLALLTSAIITYVTAELVHGNGVLAITAFGLIFGNTKIHHKIELENFASIFSYTLEILVFILMGTFLIIHHEYILKGTMLFLSYLIVRFVSVIIIFPKTSLLERGFMTFNVPKGIDVAIIVLLLIAQYKSVPGMEAVINVSMLFILYSVVLSTFIGTLFGEKIEQKESKVSDKHHSRLLDKIMHHSR